MAAGILNKFGVPLEGIKLGILHPKQSYRFRVIFKGFGADKYNRELTGSVHSVTRPKWEQQEQELHSYNSTGYIGGKHKWAPIDIEIRDDLTNAVASAIGAQVQRQVNHHEQTSAVAGNNYKFSLEVHSLDGTNNDAIESWELEGCWLTNVEYADGDYSSDDTSMIKLTVRYDVAVQVAGPNTNDGTVVGGDPMPATPGSPTGGTTFG